MIFLIIFFAILLLFALLLSIRISFFINYDSKLSVSIKILFFKYKIYPKKKQEEKRKTNDGVLNSLLRAKNSTLDLYNKFGNRLKLKHIKINGKIGTNDPFLTSMTYGATNALIGSFIALLDSYFKNAFIVSMVQLEPDFNETSNDFRAEIVLYITLFSYLRASTYSFIKNGILKLKRRKKWNKASRAK